MITPPSKSLTALSSNASRNRLWKVELQKLADELGLAIYVRHFPPGTSKWNKIEHPMFCHITENWRGRPLINHEVIVNLIANTTTTQGLEIRAELDEAGYPTGIAVSDEEFWVARYLEHPECSPKPTSVLQDPSVLRDPRGSTRAQKGLPKVPRVFSNFWGTPQLKQKGARLLA